MRFPHLFSVPNDVSTDQRRLLILLGAAFFIGQYDMALLTLALPDIQASFAIPEENLGRVIAFARLGALPAIALALIADNMGRRRMLIATLIGSSLAAMGTGLAQNSQQFMLLQFAARLCVTVDEILAITLALEMLSAQRRGWGVGFIAAMGGLGAGLGALMYGTVQIFPGGWRGLYILGGAAILVVAWMRRTLPESAMFEASAQQLRGRDYLAPLRTILHGYRKEAFVVATLALSFWFPLSAGLNFMSKYLQEVHAYTPTQISVLFLVAGTAAIFGNVIAGRLSDRYGRRPVLALAVVVNCSAFLVFYNVDIDVLLILAWVLALFSFFSAEVIISAISGELFPTSCRSTASMLRSIAGVIGAALGLLTESLLYAQLGSHTAALSLVVPVSLIGLPVIAFFLRETANEVLD